MNHNHARRPGGPARASIRSGARGRPTDSDPAARLARCSDRLDALQQLHSIGPRSQREHDAIIVEAEAIAEELVAIFRKPTPADRPVNPPIWQDGSRAAW